MLSEPTITEQRRHLTVAYTGQKIGARGSMIRHRFVPLLLGVSLLTLGAAAQQAPAARVIDLKASDGTLLKATY